MKKVFKPYNRRAAWRFKQRAAGCCIQCGRVTEFRRDAHGNYVHAVHCPVCREKHNIIQRARYAARQKVPGKIVL